MTLDITGSVSMAQLSDEGDGSIFIGSAEAPAELDGASDLLRHGLSNYHEIARTQSVIIGTGACPPHPVEPAIRGYGCSIVWPIVFHGGHEVYTVLAPTRQRLRQLLERLQEFGDVELQSVADVRPEALGVSVRLGQVFGALTERQLAVLTTAVRGGYYASPRQTSAEALAAGFGISRATFEEHLRKAEARVLEGVMASLAAHPLARVALKSPVEKAAGEADASARATPE